MKKIKINESQFKVIKNLLNEATIEDFQSVDVVAIADPRISIAFGMMFSTDMSGGIISYEVLKKIAANFSDIYFDFKDIERLINQNPNFLNINSEIKQKSNFQISVSDKINSVKYEETH